MVAHSASTVQRGVHDHMLPFASAHVVPGAPEPAEADDHGVEISGYLVFEDAIHHEARLTFTSTLDDGENGGAVAELEIPFKIE